MQGRLQRLSTPGAGEWIRCPPSPQPRQSLPRGPGSPTTRRCPGGPRPPPSALRPPPSAPSQQRSLPPPAPRPEPAALPPAPSYQERGRGQEQPAGPKVEARLEAQHHVDVPAEPLDACAGEGESGPPAGPPPARLPPTPGHRGPWDQGPRADGRPPSRPLTVHPRDRQARGDHHHHQPEAGAVVVQEHQPVHAPLEDRRRGSGSPRPSLAPRGHPSSRQEGSSQASEEGAMLTR